MTSKFIPPEDVAMDITILKDTSVDYKTSLEFVSQFITKTSIDYNKDTTVGMINEAHLAQLEAFKASLESRLNTSEQDSVITFDVIGEPVLDEPGVVEKETESTTKADTTTDTPKKKKKKTGSKWN